MLLADFKINETFAPVIAAPLPCRIAALGGEGDGRATRAQMDAWAEVAEPGKATVTMFPGGHFYLFKKEESMGAFFKFFYKDLLREAAVAAPPPPARGQLSSGSFRRPLADGVAGRQAAAFWAAAGVEVPPPLAPAPALPPPATLAELLAGRPDAPALIDGASGARLTREELSGQVAAFAAALTAAGVGAGQVVALACPNDLQLVVGLLGAAAIAAVAAPLNPASLPAEFAFTLGDLAPALLVCSAGHPSAAAALAAAAAAGVPAGTASAAGGVVALSAPLLRDGARAPTPRAPAPADVALVVHAAAGTAATRPRAAALTHANLSAAAAAAAAAYELGRADVSLLATPLWQLPALVSDLLAALLSGGPAVLPSRPDGFATAAAFWGDVAAHGVSRLTAPPPALAVLLKHAPRWADAGRPPLRFISAAGGGAVLGPGVLAEVEAAFGAPVLEALALPMVGLVAAAPLPHRGRRAPGTAGRAVPGLELSVVAAGGQEGELLVRGPAVFSTFWGGGGAAGGDALDPDGWHATGVRARVDADGQLHVRPGDGVGGISWFGERRDAGEVEAALSGWGPAGARLVAFAAPHRVLGEVVAVAVAGGGAAGGPAALEELRAHAAATGALPPHWLPSAAVFCPGGLPTGPDGQEVPREGLAAALGLPLLAGRAPAAFALAPDGSLSQVAAARGRALTRAVSSLAAASEEGGEVEAAVAGADAQALGVPADAVQPSSNFFELGGTSLQVGWRPESCHCVAPPRGCSAQTQSEDGPRVLPVCAHASRPGAAGL
jgi:long-chain acyl-CoA synthetase